VSTATEPEAARSIEDRIFGRRLATSEEGGQKVGVMAGLPMFGLDGLSSAAYGPEAALTLLLPLGVAGIGYIRPIVGLIVALLIIVYFSYRQTIAAYPQGGGSYTVARENLGTFSSLLAGSALLLDYILTAAVGIAAGVGALVSAAPSLHRYTLPICLVILAAITLVNLRGVRESGVAFLVPTYLFLVMMFSVMAIGLYKMIVSGGYPQPIVAPPAPPEATEAVGLWLLMRAFASGCTAMTGVEAVSNGVAAFKEPTVGPARQTLTCIIALLALMLLGVAVLCHAYGIGATDPGQSSYRSVLAQLTAAVVGQGVVYYITIGAILTVLCLSANTAFADFPRLCRAIAQDGFLPDAFGHRGRRLVYSHGIVVLAILTAALLIAFGGITDKLIPLYAVGAFLAFTLSQAGMVQHWRKQRGDHSSKSIAVNAVGATCTGITLAVVLVSKFTEGAWITVIVVPTMIVLFYAIRRHYRSVAAQLATEEPLDAANLQPPIVVLPIRGWSRITRKALRFGLKISPEIHAVHISSDEEFGDKLRADWPRFVDASSRAAGLPSPELVIVPSPYRRLYVPLVGYVGRLTEANPHRQVAVVIPELVEAKWWQYFLHNQSASLMKAYLLFSGLRRVVVINVPWYIDE